VKLAVGGRATAAGVRVVHHVVMDNRARMQQLETGGGDHDAIVSGLSGGAPAPVAKRRPQPLAPADHLSRRIDQRIDIGAQRAEQLTLLGYEHLQRLVDPSCEGLVLLRDHHLANDRPGVTFPPIRHLFTLIRHLFPLIRSLEIFCVRQRLRGVYHRDVDNGITVTGTGEASRAPDTFRAQLTVACERADVSSALGAMAEGNEQSVRQPA
jgi:hypothetical protein